MKLRLYSFIVLLAAAAGCGVFPPSAPPRLAAARTAEPVTPDGVAAEEVPHHLLLDAEIDHDRVGVRLELGQDRRVVHADDDDDGPVPHRPAGREYSLEVGGVGDPGGLAPVGAVGAPGLAEVALGEGVRPGGARRVGTVLQGDRQVAVAARLAVLDRVGVGER